MSGSDLVVTGGILVSPRGSRRADIRIHQGTIAEINDHLDPGAADVVDASGLHVLPGVIDAHSHQWERGSASRPDFRDDTASAAVGGITTIIDHPLTTPEVLDDRRLIEKGKLGERTSFLDFALHGGASPETLDRIEGMWRAGATAIKFFTCKTGLSMGGFVTWQQRRAILERLAAVNALGIVHAEDEQILEANRKRMLANDLRDPRSFGDWRTPDAESRAVTAVLEMAGEVGARVYIVHTSTPEAVAAVVAARANGQTAYVETCPHYLILSDDDIRRAGHRYTTSPPVRDLDRQARLRRHLGTDIDVIGSDHCSMTLESKAGDVFEGQPGLPSNEVLVPLMLDLVASGLLTIERLVAMWSTVPASIFGIDHRKGSVKVGLDGDLTLVDLSGQTVVRAQGMISVARWSPYEGRSLRGRVKSTIVRGTPVARDGRLLIEPGQAEWIRRAEG
jgi:dihydroorotase